MRVVIGEDEVLLRRGLELVLGGGGFDVVDAVGDARALEESVAAHRPDLVVTDIRMPPTFTDEGLVAAARIRAQFTGTAVVVLSQHVQRRYAVELLSDRAGGVGYLLKQRIADVDTFLEDLREVATGGTAIDPDIVAMMVARARLSDVAVGRLTARQQEVLALVAEGRSNASIAARLFLTEKAVVQHTSRIYDALSLPVNSDAHRRVLAVLHYLNQE
ncbi:two component transcriptional regulator, LuxR family [Sanguibacter gelidistatuariae]|uniref:Two component transcriptional regulator, LuxR family n=1 Tax=Sanguibacter gelidistatuariae TaxID=1814289 RepID=A0A1G6HI72_9MICO|nr:response regulator transcription factor [Sanguibacter gelidistatuariae]SDB93894.1 two component transcriptional regulator, LuxR family [Sanguibacter gelidistatuariae]